MYRSFLSYRYLRSRLVNLIAVGGVAAGVGVLIVVSSVMDGFRAKVKSVIRGNLSDVLLLPLTGDLPDPEQMARVIEEDHAEVEAVSAQLEATAFYIFEGGRGRGQIVVDGKSVLQMVAVGMDWEAESRVTDFARAGPSGVCESPEADRWSPPARAPICLLAANDWERPFYSPRAIDYEKAGTIMVSRTFAENHLGHPYIYPELEDLLETDVGITFLEVRSGDDNEFQGKPLTFQLVISAVYDAEDTSVDATRIFMDRETLRRLAGVADAYSTLRVRLRPDADPRVIQRELHQRFSGAFAVQVWQDQRSQFLKAVNNEKVLLLIVLSFIVLLGGFIILATLTLTVVEKTRDIGVIAALGATRAGILSIFVGSGLLIGVIGAVLGLCLGWLFLTNVNAIKDGLESSFGIQIFPPDIYLFREIPTIWDWPTVLWIMFGSIAVAFVAGLIPALRASRMDPVKALRYE